MPETVIPLFRFLTYMPCILLEIVLEVDAYSLIHLFLYLAPERKYWNLFLFYLSSIANTHINSQEDTGQTVLGYPFTDTEGFWGKLIQKCSTETPKHWSQSLIYHRQQGLIEATTCLQHWPPEGQLVWNGLMWTGMSLCGHRMIVSTHRILSAQGNSELSERGEHFHRTIRRRTRWNITLKWRRP